jgi:hypothetical protein
MRFDDGVCCCGEPNVDIFACGGVLAACELAICALIGVATVGNGAIVLEGETGTELTWMTSSWKSVALSILTAVGSGVGCLIAGEGLLFGLVCLGARGGGGNS